MFSSTFLFYRLKNAEYKMITQLLKINRVINLYVESPKIYNNDKHNRKIKMLRM